VISGDIRTKSVNVLGTVVGNIFATQRCELQANCTLHGDVEATWLVVNEKATFRGHAKVGTRKSTLGLKFALRAKRQSTTQHLAADHATL
jgi:cytoskeletal protein CcmA (bactofilin family)